MKKIISGLLGIVVIASVVGGIAYAQFVTPAASVQGIQFNTGSSELRVWNGASYELSYDVPWNFSGLYPGVVATPTNFWLKNTSSVPVDLTINGKLRAGVTGDWDLWKDNLEVAITEHGVAPTSDWHTLNEWFTTGFNLPGGVLAQNTERQYDYHVRVKLTATGLENRTLSGVNFDFVGTQTP